MLLLIRQLSTRREYPSKPSLRQSSKPASKSVEFHQIRTPVFSDFASLGAGVLFAFVRRN